MKKIIIPIFTLAVLLGTGCKKEFFDINTSPNSPTETSITPQVLLPRTLHSVGLRVGTSFDYAADWTGYWSRSGSYGQSIELESYNITSTTLTGQWSNWYDILTDVNLMEKKAQASGLPFYQGVAKTIKALGFMYLVDQYNNVPYSKAFDFVGNITPAYDKGEDIYADLFVQLDAAGKLFANAGTLDAATQASDIMFKGDLTLWRKFVNTMRLKLLIHESQVVSAATISTVTAQITADGSGYLGIGQSALVNPGYVQVDTKQNPFYNTYKLSALGVKDTYNRANNYILRKYFGPDAIAGTADDDIRYKYVFSVVDTKLAAFPGAAYDYVGTNFGEVVPNSDPFRAVNQSDVAGPGLAKSPVQSQAVLTSSESLFLQAEAAQRGWISGTPQTLLTNAVRESFSYLAVPNAIAAADAYLALGTPAVNYAAAADKVRFLAMQKYYALIGVANFEAYVDYRRLGVPTDLPLSLNANRINNVIPLRLQYPQTEFNFNQANVSAQGTINPQTSAIFWDK